jgi:hypothetical protein
MGILAGKKLGKMFGKFLSKKPGGLDAFIYGGALIFCYFVFNQTDLLHTGGSSFTYLNLHFRDFYEVNRILMPGVNYLPSTYILFAVWNIPVRLLGLVYYATLDVGCVIFWYKLLPTLFLALSAYYLYKIGKVIGLNKANSILMTAIWVSSPILFFSQFIFGQYDIFCAFFVLVGLYYFLKRNIWAFVLFFGIAVTFKYFPLFIFVPLLLLVEKDIKKIPLYMAPVMVFVCLQVLFYISSPSFRAGVMGFSVAGMRLKGSFLTIWPGINIYFFISLWFIISGLCYLAEPITDKNKFYQTVFYICLLVCGALFALIFWHPQWLLLITPFLAITTFMDRRIRQFLLLDLIMMGAFVGFTVNVWQMNVDQQMFKLGLLAGFNPSLFDPDKVLRMARIFISGANIYLNLFTAILVLNLLCKFPTMTNKWNGNDLLAPVDTYWNYARLRFVGGVAIFIIPAFISFFYTLKQSPPSGRAGCSFNEDSGKYRQKSL